MAATPGDGAGVGIDARPLHLYVARHSFKPEESLGESMRSLYLKLKKGDRLVVRVRGAPGEWVYVSRFKKPTQEGYVPWDFLEEYSGTSDDHDALIAGHKVRYLFWAVVRYLDLSLPVLPLLFWPHFPSPTHVGSRLAEVCSPPQQPVVHAASPFPS